MNARAADNGVAQKPLMGWSSWSALRGPGNENRIKGEADAMAEKLEPFGYTYINLDSGWDRGYDEYGRPETDRGRFPGGMAELAEYMHGKGLKLGVYMMPGIPDAVYQANPTIMGTSVKIRDIVDPNRPGDTLGRNHAIDFTKPGAAEYIQSCVDLFASWGIDYIKMDFVGPGGGKIASDNRGDIKAWMTAIKKNGRPIWLELSNSLKLEYVDTWKTYANGWRIDGDVEGYHTSFLTNWNKVSKRFDDAVKWAGQGGPGGWNDMDSIEIGAGEKDGLTENERYSVFTLWSICCAPIILGPDLVQLDDGDLKIITNPEVIAVQQAGRPATPIVSQGDGRVWEVQNPDGTNDVAFFNLGEGPETITATLAQLQMSGTVMLHDLWSRSELGTVTYGIRVPLDSHACRLLKLTQYHPI